jgi:hypothetical protein
MAKTWRVERVVQDVHGLMVFTEEPWPKFVLGSLELRVGQPGPRLVKAIEMAEQIGIEVSDREKTAFELYSKSMLVAPLVADARFLMLMMAMETLIDQEPRSEAAIAHVDRMIETTGASGLSSPEIDSLVSSLTYLRGDSIGAAGRRLVRERLGERAYGDPIKEPAAKFLHRLLRAAEQTHARPPSSTDVQRGKRACGGSRAHGERPVERRLADGV